MPNNVQYERINPNGGALPAGTIVEAEIQSDGSQRQVVKIGDLAQRVQTPTGNALQVQIGPGDVISNIPVVILYEHHQLHEGETWQAGYGPAGILVAAVVDHLVKVADVAATTRTPHMVFELDSTSEVWIQIYETPTTTANGTPITCFNRNRNTAGSPTTTIFITPTVTAAGTLITSAIVGSGEKSGGSGRDANEWDLKANTNYLVRITGKNAGNVCMRFQFYEDMGV
jgi:hypothetical protein